MDDIETWPRCPECTSQDTFRAKDRDSNIWIYCNKCGYNGKWNQMLEEYNEDTTDLQTRTM